MSFLNGVWFIPVCYRWRKTKDRSFQGGDHHEVGSVDEWL